MRNDGATWKRADWMRPGGPAPPITHRGAQSEPDATVNRTQHPHSSQSEGEGDHLPGLCRSSTLTGPNRSAGGEAAAPAGGSPGRAQPSLCLCSESSRRRWRQTAPTHAGLSPQCRNRACWRRGSKL